MFYMVSATAMFGIKLTDPEVCGVAGIVPEDGHARHAQINGTEEASNVSVKCYLPLTNDI